ncbi:MAG: hypothetical protein GY714_08555 [Desulfobacterales bacterium]|nr:hypothetical protein [Desulfobacterales bacterium]
MIRIEEILLGIDHEDSDLTDHISSILDIDKKDIPHFSVSKRAIDSRNKRNIKFAYSVDVQIQDENSFFENFQKKSKKTKAKIKQHRIRLFEPYVYKIPVVKEGIVKKRPIVVGTGPSGIFCGLVLAKAGLRPLIIERGKDVDSRIKDVDQFFSSGELNTESNVQFGEGGAGTFSDGKLNTLIKNPRTKYIFEQFILNGASEEIGWNAKPHIGTDKLIQVVKNMRKDINDSGGEILFNTCLTDIKVEDGKVVAAVLNDNKEIETDDLIIATGHSARDTYEMLYERGLDIKAKPFSIGVRIEHEAESINKARYHDFYKHPKLPVASYKLVAHNSEKRSVYTFCMCPGGYVVAAASEKEGLVVNGMSEYSQGGENSNSALLVNVNPNDFESDHPLAGIEFQRKWEKLAFIEGGKNYCAPAQRVGDFINTKSTSKNEVSPTYKPGVRFTSLDKCLPDYVIDSIKEALPVLGRKIKGFDDPDAILTGVETRSSSPVKLFRDDNLQSNINGIFPAGEGSGYAGGIVSSAVDGLKVAEIVIEKYNK